MSDAHDSGGKRGREGVSNRFHASRPAHPAGTNDVHARTLDSSVFVRGVCVKLNHQEWGLDGEVVESSDDFLQ